MKIRMEDIIFWVLITLIVGIAIWKMIGSPTDTPPSRASCACTKEKLVRSVKAIIKKSFLKFFMKLAYSFS